MRGCPGQALESRRATATGASSFSACGLCVTVRRGLALRRALLSPDPAARRRPGCRSPCGNRAVVQPGSRRWRAGAAHSAATPGGQSQALQTALAMSPTGPRGFRAPRSLPGVRSCWRLSATSAHLWHLTSPLDTRGHPRMPSGDGCQAQAPGIIPFSLLYSPLWQQSPEPCQPLGPGTRPAAAQCSKDIGLDVTQGEARGLSRGPGSSLSLQEGCHCRLRGHSGILKAQHETSDWFPILPFVCLASWYKLASILYSTQLYWPTGARRQASFNSGHQDPSELCSDSKKELSWHLPSQESVWL
ncbi:uncharacterized protein LOC128096164 [Peromyscus californicus insignis]|uniref:uncharacterized protein LOC128096164 n=1 Tax=Peromyscus californicus insignis TaxID=564181 RepID=UPI0022A7E4A5|nr:uncharacterized protein LOC128096164 [Peromyscus californicus insignis]